MKINFDCVSYILSAAMFALIITISPACDWKTDSNQTTENTNLQSPTPTPELNEKRLPTMWFEAWHPSKPGMILEEGSDNAFYLAVPGEKPTAFNEYKVENPAENLSLPRSHSGKFEVAINKFNERTRQTDCCAIQEFDYEVVLFEVAAPENKVKLANEQWEFKGWSPDDSYLLFSGAPGVFLINSETKEKIPVFANRSLMRYVFDPNGKGLFTINYSKETTRLEFFDFASRQLTTLLTPLGSEPEMMLSPDGGKLALFLRVFTGNTTLTAENYLHLFDVASKAKIRDFPMPKGVINAGNSGWQAKGNEFGFTAGGKNYTQDVYSINVETGKVTSWYPPEGETTGLYKLNK